VPFYQFDTSALVKRYVNETGSIWVRTIVDLASGNVISTAQVTRAEVASALARRAREGSLSLVESERLIQAFEVHCLTQYRLVPTEPRRRPRGWLRRTPMLIRRGPRRDAYSRYRFGNSAPVAYPRILGGSRPQRLRAPPPRRGRFLVEAAIPYNST
jgi:hypothetical protein